MLMKPRLRTEIDLNSRLYNSVCIRYSITYVTSFVWYVPIPEHTDPVLGAMDVSQLYNCEYYFWVTMPILEHTTPDYGGADVGNMVVDMLLITFESSSGTIIIQLRKWVILYAVERPSDILIWIFVGLRGGCQLEHQNCISRNCSNDL